MCKLSYGQRMRVLKMLRNMTQDDLAIAAKTNRTHLWQAQSDAMIPNTDLDRRIRKALGWTPAMDRALDALAVALDEEGGYCTAES